MIMTNKDGYTESEKPRSTKEHERNEVEVPDNIFCSSLFSPPAPPELV